jgi:hypothetical protein
MTSSTDTATFGELRNLQRRASARCDRFTRGTSEHNEAVEILRDCDLALGEGRLDCDLSDEKEILRQQLDANRRCAGRIRALLDVTDDQIQVILRKAIQEKLRAHAGGHGYALLEDVEDRLIATCCVALGLVSLPVRVDPSPARKRCAELIFLRWGYGA